MKLEGASAEGTVGFEWFLVIEALCTAALAGSTDTT